MRGKTSITVNAVLALVMARSAAAHPTLMWGHVRLCFKQALLRPHRPSVRTLLYRAAPANFNGNKPCPRIGSWLL